MLLDCGPSALPPGTFKLFFSLSCICQGIVCCGVSVIVANIIILSCKGQKLNLINLNIKSLCFEILFLRFVCGCVYLHVHADTCGGQKRAPKLLELELQVVVCNLV